MKLGIACIIVLALARLCYWFGSVLVAFPVAGCLARASDKVRGFIAGTLSGLAGVAASCAFALFIFQTLGANEYSVLALLAATTPLIIPLRRDLAQAGQISDDVAKLRSLGADTGSEAIAVGAKFRAVGCILGACIIFVWFFAFRR